MFLVLGVLLFAYAYFLMHTTDAVLAQTRQLNSAYQSVVKNAGAIAGQ